MLDKTSLFSSSNKHATKPSGNALNASSVGANTVYGPFGSLKISTNSAAPNAATNVLKIPAAAAVVGMSTRAQPHASLIPSANAAQVSGVHAPDMQIFSAIAHVTSPSWANRPMLSGILIVASGFKIPRPSPQIPHGVSSPIMVSSSLITSISGRRTPSII